MQTVARRLASSLYRLQAVRSFSSSLIWRSQSQMQGAAPFLANGAAPKAATPEKLCNYTKEKFYDAIEKIKMCKAMQSDPSKTTGLVPKYQEKQGYITPLFPSTPSKMTVNQSADALNPMRIISRKIRAQSEKEYWQNVEECNEINRKLKSGELGWEDLPPSEPFSLDD